MRQEEIMKEKALKGVQKIYMNGHIGQILQSQIISFFPHFVNLLQGGSEGLPLSARLKLYDYLTVLVLLGNE